MNIEEIENSKFLKSMTTEELSDLSQDIRSFIMHSVARTGGHFSSNLGIVELTVALHYVFDFPRDKIAFDVGHQSYVHKVLSGRAKELKNIRQYGGISGFQKRKESPYDCWEAGHSSTAISGSIGIATARDLNKEDYQVIAVVGDAAIMSGESFEALNYLGTCKHKVIVILNDNNMSITKNVGGLSNMLSEIRVSEKYKNARDNYVTFLKKSKTGERVYQVTKKMKDVVKDHILDESVFTKLGLDYLGPIDGHNMEDLISALNTAKDYDHSVIVHVETVKGKGYEKAEKDKIGLYHGVKPFDLNRGIVPALHTKHQSWSEAIANHVEFLMGKHQDICVITPAMITGSSLNHIFKHYPDRSFDVGIAEEHAMTFAAGLAISGKFPFLSIYSSFSQRAYDQLNHDIARMDLPCLIGIDRAGLVGEDGPTHHGVFDIGYMMPIPNLIIMAPHNQKEAELMMNTAYKNHDHPYIIRYSKNMIHKHKDHQQDVLNVGSWKIKFFDHAHLVSVITYGDQVKNVENLIREYDLPVNLINARFLKPMDEQMLDKVAHTKIIVFETDMLIGGLGEAISFYYSQHHTPVELHAMGIGDHYVTHGSVKELLKREGLTMDDLLIKIRECLNG
ncbi:1-deoxy-D-xylulose-5-phosphate synthase [Sharpea azabuensis]|uniref:1-deoxy-D-xylulose-5-phosphate synthase n=1 Tax=Sharpea porci TaxID=2652286 RepID=A0A844FSM5_9FIRM|nr:1-deoxy-D-xylulose-5-phosphate synthase [Sharpea porci]MST88440.1 1-deoxy-D-xylulose-5-phosphate synthase [Sharpea porci]